jgi:hypothetical protein
MMIKLLKRAVVLGLTAVVLFAGAPAQTVKAADVAPLHTSVAVAGKGAKQTVSYDLNLDKVEVTDGRVAVTFDKDVLELTGANDSVNFDTKDLNREYVGNDEEGVSYAFVNGDPKKRGGRVLRLKFAVKADAQTKAQETVIKTQVFGINDLDEEVVSATVIEDAVTVGRDLPVVPQNVTATEEIGGVRVQWTKDANADGYVVYRSSAADGKYTKVATTSSDHILNLNAARNKDYYYKVVAFQNGTPSYYTEASEPVKITVKKIFGIF